MYEDFKLDVIEFFKIPEIQFLLIVIAILIVAAIVRYIYTETFVFEKIAGFYYNQKTEKDFYHYIRVFKLRKYSATWKTPIIKTLNGIFGIKCNYLTSHISGLENSSKSLLQVQKALKVFKYVLFRLENSQDYKKLISCYKQGKFRDFFAEEIIKEILKETLEFIEEIQKNKNLNSIDTTLYFNGVNLSEMLKQYRKENKKCRYSDLVDSVMNINCAV